MTHRQAQWAKFELRLWIGICTILRFPEELSKAKILLQELKAMDV